MSRKLKFLFLFSLSLAGLFYSFENIELSQLLHHFGAIDLYKFSLSVIILIFSCIIRAKRLQYLAFPIDRNVTTHVMFGATMIGYFGNGVLFFRLGELLKSYAISKQSSIKQSESLGLIMLERTLDTLTVFFLLIFSIPLIPLNDQKIRFWIIAFISIAFILIVILFLLKIINWKIVLDSFRFIKKPIKTKLLIFINQIFRGFELVFQTNYKLQILFSTFIMWICYFLMTKWLIEACNIELNLLDIFIILLMGAIIVSVPALPGGIGTYEAGITYSLTFLFAISKDLALTYAILSHASNYLPYLIIGSFYFIKSGIKINYIRNE